MTVWCPVMFRDELDMLQMRLEETTWARTVVTEATVTHRGVPKPLNYAENLDRFLPWEDAAQYVITSLPDDPNPWVREHAQRNAAWPFIDAIADDDDMVIIGDCDEIPEFGALPAHRTSDVYALRMRTYLYAVDWEAADQDALPPTCVMATAGYIRGHGGDLAGIRDRRSEYPEVRDGGWHFSWLGGPEAQRRKLDEATCHTEINATPEAALIRSGARYYDGADGGGIPVKAVDVDNSFPAMIRERRCPPEWFRP